MSEKIAGRRIEETGKRRQSASCFSFTLVELLVVLVIICILAGMGLVAMQHIGRATALSGGARQFANHINMARNYAIANRAEVCLVVANNLTTTDPSYPYSAYGFCVSFQSNNITCFRYIDDIQFLPRGVVITNLENGTDITSKPVSFPNDGCANLTPAWFVQFKQNGQLTSLTQRPVFTMVEGIYDPTTSQPKVTGVSSNSYQIAINPLIGKPMVLKKP
jgi:prepilin-type N-terminal cleavage/methylation domain-containing protein